MDSFNGAVAVDDRENLTIPVIWVLEPISNGIGYVPLKNVLCIIVALRKNVDS